MGDGNNRGLSKFLYFPRHQFISCSNHTLYSAKETAIIACIFGASFLTALVLNILIYLGFFVRKNLESLPCGRIIRHLMVPSDLMVTLIIPIHISMFLCGSFFPLPFPVCPLFWILAYVGGIVSKFSVTFVAFERFIAIRWPLKHKVYFTTKVEWCAIIVTWAISLILVLAENVIWPLAIGYYQEMPVGICDSPLYYNVKVSIVHRILAWYAPFTMTIISYALLVISVRSALGAINKAVSNEAFRVCRNKSIKKTFRLASLIIFAFGVSWMPFQVVEVLHLFKVSLQIGRINWRGYAIFIAYANVVINPVVYFFMDPKFRDAVLRLILCRCRKNLRTNKVILSRDVVGSSKNVDHF